MQFGAVILPTLRLGAVLIYRKCYDVVRCGFHMSGTLRCGSLIFEIPRRALVRFSYSVKPTMRCGAVFKRRKCYGAVPCVKNPGYPFSTPHCVLILWHIHVMQPLSIPCNIDIFRWYTKVQRVNDEQEKRWPRTISFLRMGALYLHFSMLTNPEFVSFLFCQRQI